MVLTLVFSPLEPLTFLFPNNSKRTSVSQIPNAKEQYLKYTQLKKEKEKKEQANPVVVIKKNSQPILKDLETFQTNKVIKDSKDTEIRQNPEKNLINNETDAQPQNNEINVFSFSNENSTNENGHISPQTEEIQRIIDESPSEIAEIVLNENNQIIQITDVHQKTTQIEYNENGDPIKIVEPDGKVTYFAYDENGNLISVYTEKLDSNSLSHTKKKGLLARIFSFLKLAFALENEEKSETKISYEGDNISEIQSESGSIKFQYDENENLLKEEASSGDRIEYIYDELGNVIGKRVTIPDQPGLMDQSEVNGKSSGLWSYFVKIVKYPIHSFSKLLSRIFAQFNENQTLQEAAYVYDDQDNLTEFVVNLNQTGLKNQPQLNQEEISKPQTSSSSENASTSSEGSIQAPQTETGPVSRLFNKLKIGFAKILARIFAQESIESSAPESSLSVRIQQTFDALGNVLTSTNQKGETTTYFYDEKTNKPLGLKVTNAKGELIYEVNYTLDLKTGSWQNKRDSFGNYLTFQYDEEGELIGVLQNGKAVKYVYSPEGNRLSAESEEGVTKYVYEGNRLVKVIKPDGSTISFTFDDLGNVVEKEENGAITKFSYSINNYLESITLPDGTIIRYTFDPLGRRISKTITQGDQITKFYYVYEGNNLVAVKDEKGKVLRQYVYDPKGNLIALIKDGIVYSVIRDSLGSVVALTDEFSNIVAKFNYDVWGNLLSPPNPDLIDFYFASYYYEPLAKLYILGPRAYDPQIGRFLSKDPLPGNINERLSQNEYIYAHNDPINKKDPTGKSAVWANISDSPKGIAWEAKKLAEELTISIEEIQKSINETNLAVENLNKKFEELKQKGATNEELDIAFQNLISEQRKLESLQIAYNSLLETQSAAKEMAEKNLNEVKRLESEALAKIEQQTITSEFTTTASSTLPANSTSGEVQTTTTTENATNTTSSILPLTSTFEGIQSTTTESSTTQPSTSTETNGPVSYLDKIYNKLKLSINKITEKLTAQALAKGKSSSRSSARSSYSRPSFSSSPRSSSKPANISARIQSQQYKKTNAVSNLVNTHKINSSSLRAQNNLKKVTQTSSNNTIKNKTFQSTLNRTTKITQSALNQTSKVKTSPPVSQTYKDQKTINQVTATKPITPQKPNTNSFKQNNKQVISEAAKQVGSVGISLIPIIGEGYDLATLISGKDPITGEKLNDFTKTLTVIGLFSGFGSGAVARKSVTFALEKLAKELGLSIDEILQIAQKVAQNYKITSLDDIKKLKGKLDINSFIKEVRKEAEILTTTKAIKLLEELKSSKTVEEFLEKTEILKHPKASSGIGRFFQGTKEDAKELFEKITKGWQEEIKYNLEGQKLIVRYSPDGKFNLTYREFYSGPVPDVVKSVEVTIDVVQNIPKKGLIAEIKFGSLK